MITVPRILAIKRYEAVDDEEADILFCWHRANGGGGGGGCGGGGGVHFTGRSGNSREMDLNGSMNSKSCAHDTSSSRFFFSCAAGKPIKNRMGSLLSGFQLQVTA